MKKCNLLLRRPFEYNFIISSAPFDSDLPLLPLMLSIASVHLKPPFPISRSVVHFYDSIGNICCQCIFSACLSIFICADFTYFLSIPTTSVVFYAISCFSLVLTFFWAFYFRVKFRELISETKKR